MADAVTTSPTLAGALWPARTDNRLWRAVLLAVLGSALLTLSAKIQVLTVPVPITLQTMVVLLIGMSYGTWLAGATIGLYLLQGALGAPVFATGGGIAYFAGPTAGFLIGFLVAGVLMGWLSERGWDRHIVTALGAMLAGTVVIFALGLVWLSILYSADTAIEKGLMPFLWSEACKIALGATLLPLAWQVVRAKPKDGR